MIDWVGADGVLVHRNTEHEQVSRVSLGNWVSTERMKSAVGGAGPLGRVDRLGLVTALAQVAAFEEQPGYAKWDFDLTYHTREDRFYVGAYLDNAFDKTALAFSFVTPFSAFLTSTLQPPRTFGVRAGAHF